ncbi:MAG: hypothetical protein RLZZ618_720 [Pseudomonadota bacterium]|jgi:lipase chaperone LimK
MSIKISREEIVWCSFVLICVIGLTIPHDSPSPQFLDTARHKGLRIENQEIASPQANLPIPSPRFVTGTELLPASLRDTDVAGGLEEDIHGNLRITPGVRSVFDYFLSAEGEEPTQVLSERIRTYIRSQLKERSASQAIELFTQYMAYKDRLLSTVVGQSGQTLAEVKARRDATHQLRRASFHPDVYEAFFGYEELTDRYEIERHEVLRDASLSPEAKAEKLIAAREKLTPAVRESMNASEVVFDLTKIATKLSQQDGAPQELRAAREALVGIEATARLEAMDREDLAWQRTTDSYLAMRDAIRSDTTLSKAMRNKNLERIRAGFTEGELVRIFTLESIHDAKVRAPGSDPN